MPLKAILNSLIASIISCIFAIGFKYIGIYLIIFSYFSSLPIFIATFYYGLTGIIVCTLITIFIMSSLTSFNVGLMFFITNILPVTLILFEKRRITFNYLNFISKLTLVNSILYLIFSFIFQDKISDITKNLATTFNKINNNITIDQSIIDLAPSIVIFSWNIILILNLIFARIILTKYFKNVENFSDKIINIHLPKWLIGLFIFFLIPSSILNAENSTWFRSLALIYAIPITIQGIGVIHVFLKKKKTSEFLIYTFYTIIFLIPIITPIITAIGVLEHLYDFRRLKIKKINRDID